jgi:hypothetical protein
MICYGGRHNIELGLCPFLKRKNILLLLPECCTRYYGGQHNVELTFVSIDYLTLVNLILFDKKWQLRTLNLVLAKIVGETSFIILKYG